MAQECYETEACTDSGFSFEISAQEGGINVVTDYETYALTALSGSSPDTNVRSYVGRTSGAVHLLSVMDNAQARYMLHTTDGLAQVSYAGTCEVIK